MGQVAAICGAPNSHSFLGAHDGQLVMLAVQELFLPALPGVAAAECKPGCLCPRSEGELLLPGAPSGGEQAAAQTGMTLPLT